jgi:hypothetical protein
MNEATNSAHDQFPVFAKIIAKLCTLAQSHEFGKASHLT